MAHKLSKDLGEHYLDTGPLLCLGGSPPLADAYDSLYLAAGRVVRAVVDEIDRKSQMGVPPGDPYRTAELKRAAQRASARYRDLLAGANPTPAPTPDLLSEIREALKQHDLRRNPGQEIPEGKHEGEAESIHAAVPTAALLITGDGGARSVARTFGVATETFADVARRVSREQVMKPKQVLAELQKLGKASIDIGDVVNSILDLATV